MYCKYFVIIEIIRLKIKIRNKKSVKRLLGARESDSVLLCYTHGTTSLGNNQCFLVFSS